ncbi:hypothetical protein [Cohnella kolymensis]|uniref:hypothetical protein n=1 Tax=Cohnella kolymensis TaxID=1590652 RepID=UPI000A4E2159|nr:hypothetical protein [Cohnella kolymensis]
MMKRTPALYYLSWALVLVILLTAVFGDMIKPHGTSEADKLARIKQEMNGKSEYSQAPFPPSSNFMLGTDHRGFDLVSLMLAGLKYTLGTVLLLTLLRFSFSRGLGAYGLGSRVKERASCDQCTGCCPPCLRFCCCIRRLRRCTSDWGSTWAVKRILII